MKIEDLPKDLVASVRRGVVIPAHPLALNARRQLDERRQKALTRYYVDAGAGGLAVGVHTTQFEIRQPRYGLYKPVLRLASETIDCHARRGQPFVKIAGICGKTRQAVGEAALAVETGYHAGLLSLAAMATEPLPKMIAHCRAVSQVIPLVGFYLQPSVGGCVLPYEFWCRFAEIENVLAIKMAPFNRYQTFDVLRAVCEAGREKDIALYTGNDDHIVLDLLTEHRIKTSRGTKSVRIVGGLLGHWACWTRKAVEQLDQIHRIVEGKRPIPIEVLTRAVEVTDANAAFFDSANSYKGCIAGIHEVLRMVGLLKGIWCLNPHERLSPGQAAEIRRVFKSYPHLSDADFVNKNIHKWLAD